MGHCIVSVAVIFPCGVRTPRSSQPPVTHFANYLAATPNFVPTMGALHEGHLSLVQHAATLKGPCVVSIFLNPTQFAPGEDLESYPRTLESDLKDLEAAGADIVFVPTEQVVYPDGIEAARTAAQTLELPLVAVRPGLEEGHRPHFFGGVCLVVGRLLDLVRPSTCVMGEKDYQQLLVLQAMVRADRDRFGTLEVIGCPTVRDPDGLAMSSRNAYLNERTRPHALGLVRALEEAQRADSVRSAGLAMRRVLMEHELEVDYAVIRDAATLDRVSDSDNLADRPLRALVAARLDGIRLIDNCSLTTPHA